MVVRGRARSCVVVRGRSCTVVRARSCVVRRARSCVVVNLCCFAASTVVARNHARTHGRTTYLSAHPIKIWARSDGRFEKSVLQFYNRIQLERRNDPFYFVIKQYLFGLKPVFYDSLTVVKNEATLSKNAGLGQAHPQKQRAVRLAFT